MGEFGYYAVTYLYLSIDELVKPCYNGQFQTSAIRVIAVGFNNLDGYSGILSVCTLSMKKDKANHLRCPYLVMMLRLSTRLSILDPALT